ncbi:MAG: hypothetical protein ABSA11_11485 [Candidatus Bathyarchaeia archaeon]
MVLQHRHRDELQVIVVAFAVPYALPQLDPVALCGGEAGVGYWIQLPVAVGRVVVSGDEGSADRIKQILRHPSVREYLVDDE